jgi:hypothetical protein
VIEHNTPRLAEFNSYNYQKEKFMGSEHTVKGNPAKKEEKNEGVRTQNMLIFGDIHIFPEAYDVLTHSLDKLQAEGASVVYFESSSENDDVTEANIDELLLKYRKRIIICEMFPDGKANLEKILANQKILSNFYGEVALLWGTHTVMANIQQGLNFDEGRLAWLKGLVRFLEKVKALHLKIICIDMQNTERSYKERNIYMVRKILLGLKKYPASKNIIVTGFNHIHESWCPNPREPAVRYNRYSSHIYASSIPRLLLVQGVNIEGIFSFYPTDIGQDEEQVGLVSKARQGIDYCGHDVARLIQLKPISSAAEGSKIVQAYLAGGTPKKEGKSSKPCEYHIPIRNEEHLEDLKAYLADIKAKIIGKVEVRERGNRTLHVQLPFSLAEKTIELSADLGLYEVIAHPSLSSKLLAMLPSLLTRGDAIREDGLLKLKCYVPYALKSTFDAIEKKSEALFEAELRAAAKKMSAGDDRGLIDLVRFTEATAGTAASVTGQSTWWNTLKLKHARKQNAKNSAVKTKAKSEIINQIIPELVFDADAIHSADLTFKKALEILEIYENDITTPNIAFLALKKELVVRANIAVTVGSTVGSSGIAPGSAATVGAGIASIATAVAGTNAGANTVTTATTPEFIRGIEIECDSSAKPNRDVGRRK